MDRYQEIVQVLYTYLARFRRNNVSLDEHTNLVADLGMESINVMELLQEIEDHFDLSVPLNVMADIRTVQDLARLIQRLIVDKT